MSINFEIRVTDDRRTMDGTTLGAVRSGTLRQAEYNGSDPEAVAALLAEFGVTAPEPAVVLAQAPRHKAGAVLTAAEVDALPLGSLVRDADNDLWQRYEEGWAWVNGVDDPPRDTYYSGWKSERLYTLGPVLFVSEG